MSFPSALMSELGPIVVVCTANICRSPMAAALLQHALAAQPEPLKSLKVISAGVAARTGESVSENSVFALKKVGIDVSQHRAQPLTQKLLDEALIVLCMTESHRAMIEVQADPVPKNLFLFRQFLPGDGEKEIGDPYGGPFKVYESARDEMVESIPSLVERLKTLISPPPAS
ncbi:MAG: low molecular weight protein arginine phosphatase [Opitutaceae bacterium]|nr:low molecular weight protein arginine phosphatase [Opitutaceae bacterium]